jgi:hypothetical protein
MLIPGCYVDILIGHEKFTNQTLVALYIGSYRNYSFLVSKLFNGEVKQLQSVRTHPLAALIQLRELGRKADILIVDLDYPYAIFFQSLKGFRIPPWVKQQLPLPSSHDRVLTTLPRKARKEAQRWIRKFDYSYHTTRETDKFIQFYTDFYTPFIHERHGKESEVVDLNFFLAEAKGGFLLWLRYKDLPVGAALLKEEAGVLRCIWVGFREKNLEGEIKGASDVLDYFTILYAAKQGNHLVDFGPTRPLANDGVFRYKQKWGAEVTLGKFPNSNILIQPQNKKAVIHSIFSSHLWLGYETGGISILYMLNDETLNRQKMNGYEKSISKGISCLHFFVTDQTEALELAPMLSGGPYKISSMSTIQA